MRTECVRGSGGFTLVELMIVIVITAILAGIALPAYTSFITKSKVRTAQADLVSLSLAMENFAQQTLSYPASASDTTAVTNRLCGGTCSGANPSPWNPASASADFEFTITTPATGGAAYSLSAVGQSSRLSDCTVALDANNNRSLTSGCGTGSTAW